MTEFEFTKDGLPLYTLDLPTVHYEGDLAAHVLPLWEAAGIESAFYNTGRTGTVMMIADPARLKEAKHIALLTQLRLERQFNEFGPEENEITAPCGGAWRRLGTVRRHGRTLSLTIDPDVTIKPGHLAEVIDWAGDNVEGMLAALLNAEGVIDLSVEEKAGVF
jgi:hypothetical protein